MVGKEGFRIGGGSGCTVDHEVSYSELPGGVIQNVYLIALRRRMLANFVYSMSIYNQHWKNNLAYFKKETMGHWFLDFSSVASVNSSFRAH